MIALPLLAGRIFGVPLAIERGKLEAIVAAVAPRLLGGSLPGWDDDDPDQREPYTVTPDGIAIIDIQGTLVSKSAGMAAASGLTSYAQIASDFSSAMANPSIRGIVLNIDSQGGEVRGMFDLADTMYSARGKKPVAALAASALSSAYLLASTADRIVCPQDAEVGSVGVVILHLDKSGADQQAGLKYSAIFAGSHKIDGNSHEPLTDPARVQLQALADTVYGMFVASVARGRGMTSQAVEKTEALTYMGRGGVNVGFADSVGTMSDALALVQNAVKGNKRSIFAAKAAKGTTMNAIDVKDEHVAEALALPAPVAGAPQPVVDTEAIKAAARTEAIADVSLIVDMCAIAGKPGLAAQFISDKTSAADVRKQLLAGKVKENGPELNSSVMPGADAATPGTVGAQGKPKPWKEIIAGVCRRKETK